MRILVIFLSLLVAIADAAPQDRELAQSPFLRPYVEQLKKDTPPADLVRIKTMAKSELILLHQGYGTSIRNKWLYGNRDPELLRFFRDNKIDHPDSMSMIVIYALWDDLNRNLSPTERASIDAKRALVARKRSAYEKLESECEALLANDRAKFERCYAVYGLPSRNPLSKDPFYKLEVKNTGRVNNIIFFQGASPEVQQCLQKPIEQFSFSAFSDDQLATLYIVEFPHCRVAERDTLHQQ